MWSKKIYILYIKFGLIYSSSYSKEFTNLNSLLSYSWKKYWVGGPIGSDLLSAESFRLGNFTSEDLYTG